MMETEKGGVEGRDIVIIMMETGKGGGEGQDIVI